MSLSSRQMKDDTSFCTNAKDLAENYFFGFIRSSEGPNKSSSKPEFQSLLSFHADPKTSSWCNLSFRPIN